MHGNESEPSNFLVENIALLPKGAKVLDVAMGVGRNAIYLARAGYDVYGVDISQEAVALAIESAEKVGVSINAHMGIGNAGNEIRQGC